ncbi:hypothetical protein GCM10010992_10060 [Cloacibacterium rupense]|uniref:Lipopolysaccharide biosynthesis protein n=1 Tax=Cloacibacterium rupense TaxID=517423 RepID=A0ABQ2NJC0_9FLAO|nr:hypothetical protein GCM10010992_10060 [Cloacibacterium rupense]
MKTEPNILLIYKNQTLSKVFENNLSYEGYDVELLLKEPYHPYQLSFLQRIINIIFRVFKIYDYPVKAEQYNFKKYCEKSLNHLASKSYDYCLVIRGDLLPEQVIRHGRSISRRMVDFQLDGLSVSSKILDYKKYFDDIFVFDPDDVKKYPDAALHFLPNCYFGAPDFSIPSEIDLLYIGQYLDERNVQLKNLHRYLEEHQLSYSSYTSLYRGRDFEPLHPKVLQHKTSTSYEGNLDFVKKSKIILDFKRKEHNGLSLRFFEAMQYGKKIITDNVSVKNYEFYHPNNIFVTDFVHLDGILEFIQKPYHPLPETLIEQYGFKNWIKVILGKSTNNKK